MARSYGALNRGTHMYTPDVPYKVLGPILRNTLQKVGNVRTDHVTFRRPEHLPTFGLGGLGV